jgi:glycosyltransferase involved in cell wall biosynthesis
VIFAEISSVSLSELDAEWLWGRHIDLPKPSTQSEASALELAGWVLGKESPAVAIELVHQGGKVVRWVPINHRRPDIARAFPNVPGAEESGFRATVSLLGATPELELWVRAVLKDQSRVPIGVIRGRRRWKERDVEQHAGVALVSVIIPCYNQARFLGEAIESVLSQNYPHFEVVVVDDGSTDNTSKVASRYPGVRCVRQENQGLAGARNTGIRHSSGSYLVFVDADDRLLPEALEVGLRHLKEHPECAFVSGQCRFIAVDGSALPTPPPTPVDKDPYETLLRNTYIWMPATVMYRRAVFETVGVFDGSVDACADYDLYLRIARDYPVHHHGEVVAEYRQHDTNMTRNPALMLAATVTVLRRQQSYVKGNRQYKKAYKTSMKFWHDLYGEPLVEDVRAHAEADEWRHAMRDLLVLLRYYPRGFVRASRNLRGLPEHIHRHGLWTRRPRRSLPQATPVRFGSLRRVTPISREFGYDRGLPIDRYYIENFLARHAEDIQGRVLEIGDDSYTRKYGGSCAKISDVLHVEEGNPQATIVADLTRADDIPSDTFDCIIFTQTLQLIYDVRAAIRTLHRILKPGGVLLATFPGVSQVARDQWGDTWYWAFTTLSAQQLFEEFFPAANVIVEARGNVLAAISFLHGLAVHELRQDELDYHDRHYQVLITLRAVKPEAGDGTPQA